MMGTENVPLKEDTKLMAAWRRLTFLPAIVALFVMGAIGVIVVIVTWIPFGAESIRGWWRDIILDPIINFIAEVK
ncbi:hypothetical protein LCGC14_0278190 [marine sediment metagenome]|uniref:Uncharacterized protein n=1 Tax=marine sediment metagenome TaxID=412755 RepID=A0A0F9WHT3_9ZZZZ